MATIRQQKLAQALVHNLQAEKPLNKQELVESVGYSHLTADRRAKEVIESEGVQQELVSMGFNEEAAKAVVAEILVAGENDSVKLKAADMVFKVHGTYAPEKNINVNLSETGPSERVRELAEKLRRATYGQISISEGKPTEEGAETTQ